MEAKHISAFVEATKAIFDTMIKSPIVFEKPSLKTGPNHYDVSGVIGLSGDVVGSVIVGFSKESAVKIASAFACCPLTVESADFADAIGELANMIAGGAKAKFQGLSVSIGCPSVVIAQSHQISSPSSVASICIPCASESGRFVIDVAFQSSAKPAHYSHAHAPASNAA